MEFITILPQFHMFLVSDDSPKNDSENMHKACYLKVQSFFAFLRPIPKPDVAPMAFFI